MSALAELAERLRAEGGLLAACVADPPEDGGSFVIETIHEGYLLHYGEGRVVRAADPDLALLAGDRLYALGLARLAEAGDVEAVARLADLISLCAQSHAEGAPERALEAWKLARKRAR